MDRLTTTEKTPACNSTYPKGAVSCSKDSFVVNQTFVLRMNICDKNRQLLVAAKRYYLQCFKANKKICSLTNN